MNSAFEDARLELTYPCRWDYKLIGASQQRLRQAIAEVLGQAQHSVALSHTSRTGKYCSLGLTVTVTDEQHRHSLFHALKRHPDVLFVL